MEIPKFNRDTEWLDIDAFVGEKIDEPIQINVRNVNGEHRMVKIYNFNTFQIDINAMYKFLSTHNYNTIIIPHNMSAAWGYMFELVKEQIEPNFIIVNYWRKPPKYLAVYPRTESSYIFKLDTEVD